MKPVLFLDFDRTLFDTDQFYEWLGNDRFERILGLTGGTLTPPDFHAYLYPDTERFLAKARDTHRLVLLTFAQNTKLQRMKVRGSGVLPLLDDVLMTIGGEGDKTGKGDAIREYFLRTGDSGWEHTFVDDAPENIHEVKSVNPDVRAVRIDRARAREGMKGLLPPDAIVHTLDELFDLL